MSDDDVLKYLSRGKPGRKAPAVPIKSPAARPARPKPQEEQSFKDFSATHLLCPTCRRAQPVRQRVMLFLSDGDLYGYSCSVCGTSVGTRKVGK